MSTARSFGIEEELVFLDPTTLSPVGVTAQMLTRGLPTSLQGYVTAEYLTSQIEYSSPVHETIDDAAARLTEFRAWVSAQTAELGVIAAATGVPFEIAGEPEVAAVPRYELVAGQYGAVATDHQITAMHVHVGISSADEGVIALNRVRAWLPVLLALSGNSPFWQGKDTGFASWRSIHMRRWTTSGCPPLFVDGSDYWQRVERLVGVGGTTDRGTIAWNVRLSEHHPTIEFRVFDTQLTVEMSTVFAAICRALVATAVADHAVGVDSPSLTPELLDASLWQAARDGMAGDLVEPVSGQLASAETVAQELLAYVEKALTSAGDRDTVTAGITRILTGGTGATRQRAAYRAGGTASLRALFGDSFPSLSPTIRGSAPRARIGAGKAPIHED